MAQILFRFDFSGLRTLPRFCACDYHPPRAKGRRFYTKIRDAFPTLLNGWMTLSFARVQFLYLVFFFSGASALLFETLWFRLAGL